TGIAADNQYVYLTAGRDMSDNGGSGDTRLYVGRYLSITDDGTTPPTVTLTSPSQQPTVIEGSLLHLAANATDDVAVATVELLVDGAVVATRTAAPYEFDYRVPTGIPSIRITARAVDLAGNQAVTPEVTVTVIPDPGTTAHGRVVKEDNSLVAGASVTCAGLTRTT